MTKKSHLVLPLLMIFAGFEGIFGGKGSYRGLPVEGSQVKLVGAAFLVIGVGLLFKAVRVAKKKNPGNGSILKK
jgi:hypothetical protein